MTKKAKVREINGVKVVQLVYPNAKGKPLPVMHPDALKHYVDVPDYVRPNMIWSEEKKDWVKREKIPPPLPKRDALIDILAEKLGMTYEELLAEKARRGVKRLTPIEPKK